MQECDERNNDLGCKRSMDEECSDLSQDDVVSSKRARQTSVTAKEITSESLQTTHRGDHPRPLSAAESWSEASMVHRSQP